MDIKVQSNTIHFQGYKSVFLGFAIAAFGALAAMTLALAEKGSKVAGKLVARERRNNDE